MWRAPTVVWCLFSRESLQIPAQTLYCQKLESLIYIHDSCYSIGLSVFTFAQLFSKAKKRCLGQALTCDPTVLYRLLSREPDRISAQTLYCQKLESLTKVSTADSMCLSLLVFTQLFLEVARSQSAKPARKRNLTRNSRSGSFKVMHFAITEKPTTDCISPYNNAVLISKVSEKIAVETAENCHCRQPQCRYTSPPRGTATNIRIYLIPPETRVIAMAYIFAADNMGLSSFRFLWWAPKDASFLQQSAYRPFRLFKVVGFGTNQKGVCDFLLVINSNVGPILHRFWDTATYWLKIANFSYPTLI